MNNKYSQSTLSKFDIIGSYFVNLYYNEFYIKSKNLKTQGTYNNITDAYKNILSSYVEFSQHPDFFKQIVKGIHTYCISTTRYTTMSHKECIDFMVSEFVPTNLWSSLRETQKNKLFHESLINCIKIFTEKIITNHLHIVIDNHNQPENITILQDLFLTIILLEKDTIFSKFINPNKNINLEVFREKLQDLLNEKKKLIDNNKILIEKIKTFDQLNQKNSNIIIELQKNNKLLINQLENIKNENSELRNNINILNTQILQYTSIIQQYSMHKNKLKNEDKNIEHTHKLTNQVIKKKYNNVPTSNKSINENNLNTDEKSIIHDDVSDINSDTSETSDISEINNKSIDDELNNLLDTNNYSKKNQPIINSNLEFSSAEDDGYYN